MTTILHKKIPPGEVPGFETATGDDRVCAWPTSECSCRIQTRDPAIAKRLTKTADCVLVGSGVLGGYLRIFAMPYTLAWVSKNVIEKLSLEFPGKNEVRKPESAL